MVIENDDRLYSLEDCLYISQHARGIPIVFDCFHHECYNNGELWESALQKAMSTGNRSKEELQIVDYSNQDLVKEKMVKPGKISTQE